MLKMKRNAGGLRAPATSPGKKQRSGDLGRRAQATKSKKEKPGGKRGFRRTPGERKLPVVLSGAS